MYSRTFVRSVALVLAMVGLVTLLTACSNEAEPEGAPETSPEATPQAAANDGDTTTVDAEDAPGGGALALADQPISGAAPTKVEVGGAPAPDDKWLAQVAATAPDVPVVVALRRADDLVGMLRQLVGQPMVDELLKDVTEPVAQLFLTTDHKAQGIDPSQPLVLAVDVDLGTQTMVGSLSFGVTDPAKVMAVVREELSRMEPTVTDVTIEGASGFHAAPKWGNDHTLAVSDGKRMTVFFLEGKGEDVLGDPQVLNALVGPRLKPDIKLGQNERFTQVASLSKVGQVAAFVDLNKVMEKMAAVGMPAPVGARDFEAVGASLALEETGLSLNTRTQMKATSPWMTKIKSEPSNVIEHAPAGTMAGLRLRIDPVLVYDTIRDFAANNRGMQRDLDELNENLNESFGLNIDGFTKLLTGDVTVFVSGPKMGGDVPVEYLAAIQVSDQAQAVEKRDAIYAQLKETGPSSLKVETRDIDGSKMYVATKPEPPHANIIKDSVLWYGWPEALVRNVARGQKNAEIDDALKVLDGSAMVAAFFDYRPLTAMLPMVMGDEVKIDANAISEASGVVTFVTHQHDAGTRSTLNIPMDLPKLRKALEHMPEQIAAAREKAKLTRVMSVARQLSVGLLAYASDLGDSAPTGPVAKPAELLATLVGTNMVWPGGIVHPESDADRYADVAGMEMPDRVKWVAANSGFIPVNFTAQDDTASTVMLFERPKLTQRDTLVVAYADGHVENVTRDELEAQLKAQTKKSLADWEAAMKP